MSTTIKPDTPRSHFTDFDMDDPSFGLLVDRPYLTITIIDNRNGDDILVVDTQEGRQLLGHLAIVKIQAEMRFDDPYTVQQPAAPGWLRLIITEKENS